MKVLNEGGNVSIIAFDGNKYDAEKIPIAKIGRKKFIEDSHPERGNALT
jgi:hypothetical protein